MPEQRRTIGQAVDEAIKETTEAWFSEHCGLRSREETAATDMTGLCATVELQKGGRLQVFVGVSARKYTDHLHDWYRYQRSGRGGYVRQEKSNPKV